MSMPEIDANAFDVNNKSKLDETLLVKFFYKTREDKVETRRQGRPIFKEVEYVDIKIAGDRAGGVCRPARGADKERFPRHYLAFKNRVEAPVTGTPLAEWSLIPRSAIEQLTYANVKTVEQLALLSDEYASQIQGGYGYKAKAAKYLEDVKELEEVGNIQELKDQNSKLEGDVSELSDQNSRLKGDVSELTDQVAKMMEEISRLSDAAASKDGVEKPKATPKRVLSEETKKKMAEGRKKAADKRKAEAAKK